MAKKKEKKEKKAGKRMSKKQLAALLIDFFHAKQSETLSMKYIFSELHLTTHPQKMLCVDILHEMLDDDYISEIEKGKFRLNNHGTEMTGTFQRKSNGKNSFIPEGGGDPIFVAERNSAHAMNNDKVKITFYAKRKNFPQSFFQFADRKCIVEVFGIFRVNSESGNFAEVLTFGNLFG